MQCAELALEKHWKVEVVAWPKYSSNYNVLRKKHNGNVTIRVLDANVLV